MLDLKDLKKAAREINLRYIAETDKGISRKKSGKSFEYFDDGKKVRDKETLERIEKLVIPPAWKDVWISPIDNSHLQATGIDDKGRKQYIYHPKWVELSQQNKFEKLIDFGLVLPKIRGRIRHDLDSKDLDKKKVIATVVWLLENTFIRVGNEEYVKENNSFGLTTLRNKHVDISGSKVNFNFKGKSGVVHQVTIVQPKIAKTIKQCIELPGFELFQYIDERGDRHVIDSGLVNEYLTNTSGENISAKEFRTWGGTVLGAVTLNDLGDYEDDKSLKTNLTSTVKEVSSHLRNTPAVCRNYYIHPVVFKTYEDKKLIPHFKYAVVDGNSGLLKDEYKVLTLLQKYT